MTNSTFQQTIRRLREDAENEKMADVIDKFFDGMENPSYNNAILYFAANSHNYFKDQILLKFATFISDLLKDTVCEYGSSCGAAENNINRVRCSDENAELVYMLLDSTKLEMILLTSSSIVDFVKLTTEIKNIQKNIGEKTYKDEFLKNLNGSSETELLQMVVYLAALVNQCLMALAATPESSTESSPNFTDEKNTALSKIVKILKNPD